MSTILNLETHVRGFDFYIRKITSGEIQIPEFQRDFIWELENVLNLLSSIKKNYPIGSFLFWKPSEKFGITKDIGPYELDDKQRFNFSEINCHYVLDGYQRISTLFGCLTNPAKNKNFNLNHHIYNSTFKIFYNLETEEFETLRGSDKFKESYIIPIHIILNNFDVITYSEKIYTETLDKSIAEDYINKLKRLNTIFTDYKLPVIEIEGGELHEAIDIFTLLNKEGKPITPDWILSAKTYSDSFRLGNLIDNVLDELEQFNFYDKKPKEVAVRELVFRCIQSSFGLLYLDNKNTDVITLSKKPEFESVVKKTAESIVKVARFLFEELLVVDSKLLPASLQFIFLVEFFNHVDEPSEDQIYQLKKWFWITSFSNYFTIYNPAKRKYAFKIFQDYILGKTSDPLFNDKPGIKFSVPDIPNKITLGSVRSKAHLLFLLNYSNFFEKVNVDEVEGYKINKLLTINSSSNYFKYNSDNANIVITLEKIVSYNPNAIILKPLNDKGRKIKDFSFMLDYDNKGDFDEHFISDDMRGEYMIGNDDKILELRHNLIMRTEKKFAESLGLDYQYLFY